MTKLIFFILVSTSINVYSQNSEFVNIAKDDLSTNNNSWNISEYSDGSPYITYISDKNRYVCELPSYSPWGFTWVNIPDFINQFNDLENGELNFDFEVIENRNSFSIGLMFDLHNVSSNCPGGDFYNLTISGRNNDIYARIQQRKDCSYKNVNNPIVANIATTKINRSYNQIKISKKSEKYDVRINEVLVLSFQYEGKLNFSNLYFTKGKYAFDNFTINQIQYSLKQSFVAETQSQKPNHSIPNIYIVLAGIKDYTYPSYRIGNLNYTVNDIEAMYSFWTNVNGGKVPKSNIILLRDGEATTSNILNSAARLFAKATEDDVIITFFSGHGDMGVFCGYDGDLKYERLNQIIKTSRAKNRLFIVDACRSGSWEVDNVLTPRGGRLPQAEALKLFYERLSNSGNGINFLLACSPDEYSADDPTYRQGTFTNYILKGVKGEADVNDDNLITLQELADYLTKVFDKWNREKAEKNERYRDGTPVRQTPQLKGNGNREMPIAVLAANR